MSSGKQITALEKEGNADVNMLTWGRHKSLIVQKSRQQSECTERDREDREKKVEGG